VRWRNACAVDTETLKEQSLEGARMGYTGKQVIHPIQVPVVQEAFSPSPKKVEWATELIKAFEEHQQSGKASTRSVTLLLIEICSLLCEFIRAAQHCNRNVGSWSVGRSVGRSAGRSVGRSVSSVCSPWLNRCHSVKQRLISTSATL